MTTKIRDGYNAPSLNSWFGTCQELTGIVLVYQGSDPGIHVANWLAGIDTGNRQVSVPLNFLPVRFQFVLVSQFVEQRGKRILIKHDA